MGEAAGSRRVRARLGDLAFSLLAAGLGFALLLATGRHLFATSVALPHDTVAHDAVSPIAPAATHVPPARVAAKSVAVARVAAKSTAVARVPAKSVAVVRVVAKSVAVVRVTAKSVAVARVAATSMAEARGAAVLGAAAARGVAPVTVPRPSYIVARTLPIAVRAPAARSRLARPFPTRPKPEKVAAPARVVAAVVVHRQRSAANVRQVLPAEKKLSHTGIVPAISARRALSVGRVRAERRPTHVRAPSIIEPPLGYEAQPAILLAPGTAQLQLGDGAIPTIRSKRRH